MKPTELPELRQRQLAFYGTPASRRWWDRINASSGFFNGNISNPSAAYLQTSFEAEVARWRGGELFYVSAHMGDLAKMAAGTMPSYTFHKEDLPCPAGVMFFEGDTLGLSANGIPVNACSWGPTAIPMATPPEDDRIEGVAFVNGLWLAPAYWLAFYTGAEHVTPSEGVERELWNSVGRPPVYYDDELALFIGTSEIDSAAHDEDTMASWQLIMRCVWLLMQQPVATVRDVELPRASRRRLERAPEPLTRTRVIQLRSTSSDSVGEGAGREYLHRWIVRGHWRRQWYASKDRHIPIWIAPHVKGPDDAPLLGGEKVYAWTR